MNEKKIKKLIYSNFIIGYQDAMTQQKRHGMCVCVNEFLNAEFIGNLSSNLHEKGEFHCVIIARRGIE
jgi:hypothetical protein